MTKSPDSVSNAVMYINPLALNYDFFCIDKKRVFCLHNSNVKLDTRH